MEIIEELEHGKENKKIASKIDVISNVDEVHHVQNEENFEDIIMKVIKMKQVY